MRAVIDTNVLISGLFWRGVPSMLLDHARFGAVSLILSPQILAEISVVLAREKFAAILSRSGRSVEQIVSELARFAEMIDPLPLPAPVCRDVDDDKFLALALSAQADSIISGDEDLLVLGYYRSVPILRPSTALKMIGLRA